MGESKVIWAVLEMMAHLVIQDHQVLQETVVKPENKGNKVILVNLEVLELVVNLEQWDRWDLPDKELVNRRSRLSAPPFWMIDYKNSRLKVPSQCDLQDLVVLVTQEDLAQLVDLVHKVSEESLVSAENPGIMANLVQWVELENGDH